MAVKRISFLGKPHLQAPMVMLKEGVHHGSGGPLFYPIEEIAKSAPRWSGVPIVIDHPVSAHGHGLDANQEFVWEFSRIGVVFNGRIDDQQQLVGDAYLDEERLQLLDPALHQRILNNETLEVSTGVYTQDVNIAGIHDGKQFSAIATFLTPNHLAVLPDQLGACSVADGCGLNRSTA